MNPIQGPIRWGSIFLLMSAALHLLAWLPGGFTADALQLIPFGVLYVILAVGLAFRWRWLDYIVFLGVIIGGIGALSYVWSASSVPAWWYLGIIAANWLCAACLFAALWRSPTMTSPP